MKRLAFALALGLLLTAFSVPTNSHAQSFKLGPRLTLPVGDISDLSGDVGIGANIRVGFPGVPIEGDVAFSYYFADITLWSADINGLYSLPITGPVSPYVGGGLGITGFETTSVNLRRGTVESETQTDFGLNLVGGAEFNAGVVNPFAELNVGVGGDVTRIGISAGVLFGF